MAYSRTDYYETIIERQIRSGRATSKSEVIHQALELLDAATRGGGPAQSTFDGPEDLSQLLRAGLASGPARPMTDERWARIGATLSGLRRYLVGLPRVGAARQPWAEGWNAVGVLLVAMVTSCFIVSSTTFAESPNQPNFIVIYGEGSGWSSSSVQMDDRNPASKSTTIRTPNLERLATAGIRFSDGYAASPRCTPSRAALFTGLSPAQLHMTFIGDGRRGLVEGEFLDGGEKLLTPWPQLELPTATVTIAEHLKRAGYATAHFGKWHLGRVSPSQHGFDESDGPTGNGGPDNVTAPNPKQALAMTAKGIDFMERQAKAGIPFYLQLSHYPNQPEKGGGQRPPKSADDETVFADQSLGQILDAVARLGLATNTYILYTTDHGTPGRNSPLTGGKGTVWEGGLRVPFIVTGPGVKAGACSHVRVTQTDLFPTFAELAGAKESLPGGIEGGSFVNVLKSGGMGAVKRAREEFVVHFPHYDKDAQGPASAIYVGDLKLIHAYETGALKLFNLASDPGERRDLAQQQPDKAKELDARLTAYLTAMNAQLPKPNPNYDPNKPAEPSRQGAKRKAKP